MPGRIEDLSFGFDAFEDILYFLVELVELGSGLISGGCRFDDASDDDVP